jgi:transcriptional regulator with XRE-family HTH domain
LTDNFFKDPEWLAKFLERIGKLMREEGLNDQNEFNEKIGIQRAITRWKTGETSPGLKSCLAIRNAFGRSLDWIIFGEEPAKTSQEIAPKSDKARPLASKDFELLSDCISKVEEEVNDEKKTLQKAQKFRLIFRVYNDCVEDRIKPDKAMVKRYLSILD